MIDLLIIVAVILFLAALLLPQLARTHRPASRISCVNSLKQLGLAYRVWAGDNFDQFPMQVSTNAGGSRELALVGDVISTFQVMSNELSTPRILVCPNDRSRTAATNFFHLKRNQVSYFVGVDAVETNFFMILSGDRNLTNRTALQGGLMEVTANSEPGWNRENLHEGGGNVGFSDGSVMQFSTPGLRTHIASTGLGTNRLAFP